MTPMGTKLAAALVKAQAEMGGAKKDVVNSFFKSKYADLSAVAEAISEAAAKHGLGYVQMSHERENAAAIETIIVHESGETYSCGVVSCPVSKADAQGYGSAMTYARRYSLSAAFGVCPEDDDGNAAAKAKPKAQASISPNDVGRELWDNADIAEREFLNEELSVIRDYLAAGNDQDASNRFYAIANIEEASAVWSQLGSKERSTIKSLKKAA